MLIDGPVEWAATTISVGTKLDLLQHAYNARLGVLVVLRGAAVALARYESAESDARAPSSEEVLEQAADELLLHPDRESVQDDAADTFRYVAWSCRSMRTHFLSVATWNRVEIWKVDINAGILSASLVGTETIARIRGVCWNPVNDILMVDTESDLNLIEVSGHHPHSLHHIGCVKKPRDNGVAKLYSWSPCGLSVARASDHAIYVTSWSTLGGIRTETPTTSVYQPNVGGKDLPRVLLAKSSKLGCITAMTLLAPSVCVIATDTPLLFEDVMGGKRSDLQMREARSDENDSGDTTVSPNANITLSSTPSSVINLTSLRVTAESGSSLLRVLDTPVERHPTQPDTKTLRSSHVSVLAQDKSGRWSQECQTALPQLSIPDVLDIQGMRVVVGSRISNSLIAAHLDYSDDAGWSIAVAGEMDLLDNHVCRGLRLAKRSPFVQVASSEKLKRTFFSVAQGSQQIHLSKYKVPRRQVNEEEFCSAFSRVACSGDDDFGTSTSTSQANASLPIDTSAAALTAVLDRMETMHAQVIKRLDQIDQRVQDMDARLQWLERR